MNKDRLFCMSSYLQYRSIVDKNRCFSEHLPTWFYEETQERVPVNTFEELDKQLRRRINEALENGPVALMLSSGMDSAILASYLPKGTQTYTLRCQATSGIDETQAAKYYADKNGLKHRVIDVYWEDFEKYTVPLMRQKGYPIHSIEVQIYKAALQAQKDGIQTLIFGETADIIYGGHSKLLAQEWTLDTFTERFAFVNPKHVLKQPMCIDDPIRPYVREDGSVDVFGFLNGFEYGVSLGFYTNACRMAGVTLCAPYSYTILGHALDITRIRSGESKYIIRELYRQLYPEHSVPDKTPLPRPMEEWLSGWEGPKYSEFIWNPKISWTGDQKWYIYALDQFMRYVVEE